MKWTQEEDDLLRAVWNSERHTAILAQFPGRSWKSLRWRANHILRLTRSASLAAIYPDRPTICLTETEAAYVAGIVDGEGWIGMTMRKNPAKGARRAYGVTTYLGVANTNTALLEWLAEKIHCRIVGRPLTLGVKPKGAGLVTNQQQIQVILHQIMPYMIIKRPQAEIMLRFLARRFALAYQAPYTQEDVDDYNELKRRNGYARASLRFAESLDLSVSMTSKPSPVPSLQTA